MNNNEISRLQQLRLAEALKDSGMMQKELAALIGYTPAGINKIFKGSTHLTRGTAQLIGQALRVRPEWLLAEDSVKTPVKKKWLLNRFSGMFEAFRLAGYELQQIEGGVLDPDYGLIPGDGVFIAESSDGSQHYKVTYAEITRLFNALEASERAIIRSFVRTACPVSQEDADRIWQERRANDLAAYNDGYQDPDEDPEA